MYISTSLTTCDIMLQSFRTCISNFDSLISDFNDTRIDTYTILLFTRKVILLKWYGKEVKKLE